MSTIFAWLKSAQASQQQRNSLEQCAGEPDLVETVEKRDWWRDIDVDILAKAVATDAFKMLQPILVRLHVADKFGVGVAGTWDPVGHPCSELIPSVRNPVGRCTYVLQVRATQRGMPRSVTPCTDETFR